MLHDLSSYQQFLMNKERQCPIYDYGKEYITIGKGYKSGAFTQNKLANCLELYCDGNGNQVAFETQVKINFANINYLHAEVEITNLNYLNDYSTMYFGLTNNLLGQRTDFIGNMSLPRDTATKPKAIYTYDCSLFNGEAYVKIINRSNQSAGRMGTKTYKIWGTTIPL